MSKYSPVELQNMAKFTLSELKRKNPDARLIVDRIVAKTGLPKQTVIDLIFQLALGFTTTSRGRV